MTRPLTANQDATTSAMTAEELDKAAAHYSVVGNIEVAQRIELYDMLHAAAAQVRTLAAANEKVRVLRERLQDRVNGHDAEARGPCTCQYCEDDRIALAATSTEPKDDQT